MQSRRTLARRLARAAAAFVTCAAVATSLLLPSLARADDAWPSKPIRLIVPFAAGGTSDVLAREIAARLQAELKQTVLVDNRGGAGGVIGADAVAKAAPDGYTILLGTIATHAINPALIPKMPYDAAKDFAPVILLGKITNVLIVGPTTPARSVAELVAYAKAHPGTMSFASAGQGTSQHLSGEKFKQIEQIDIAHVPYRGSAPAITDVMGGQVPMSFETITVALPQIRDGKVRALAVTAGKRSPLLPDVPTLQEAGVTGFDVASWQAIYAPAHTPAEIVTRLNETIARILAMPEVKARFDDLGLEQTPNTPRQFAEFQRGEQAAWAKVIKDGGIHID